MAIVKLAAVSPDDVVKFGGAHHFVDHAYSGSGKVGLVNADTFEVTTVSGVTDVEIVGKRSDFEKVDVVEEVEEPLFEVADATVWENDDDDDDEDNEGKFELATP